MILRRLSVEGWRCFAGAVELGPFGDGVNVVHGPNGIGKSTLMLALVRALFDGHRTVGLAVKLLRPWGRELNPTVTVEWEHDGANYRLCKRFHNSPFSQLSRLEEGDFVRLAEGDAADEQARRVLAGTVPGRGFTDLRHWGLAQVLWAPQGRLAVPQLSAAATRAIQSALGAQITGLGGERLERKVQDAYDAVYTPTGKLRSGEKAPRLVQLEKDLVAERESRERIVRELSAFEQTSRRIEDLRNLRDQGVRDEHELAQSLQAARRKADAYQELVSKQRAQQQEVHAAEQRGLRLKQQIDNIERTRRERNEAQENLEQLRRDAPAQAKEVDMRRVEAEDAKVELDRIRRRRQLVENARRKAQLAESLLNAQNQLAEADKRVRAIDAARREINQLRRRRSELAAPDARGLREIAAAVKSRDEAQLRLDASLITVEVLPEKDLDVEILSAEEAGRETIPAGKPRQWKGSPEVSFQLPGVATFRASGPTGSAEQLRRELAEASEKLEALMAGYGARDFGELQELSQRAEQLEAKLSQAAVKLDTLLADEQEEEIRQNRLRTANAIEEMLAKEPGWRAAPPVAHQLARDAAEVERQFIAEVEGAEAARDRANEGLTLAAQKQAGCDERQKGLERQVAAIEQRWQELCADGRDMDARREELAKALLEWDAAKAKLASIAEALRDFADDPLEEARVIEKQLEAVRQKAAQTSLDLNSEEVRLQQLGSQAPYSALAAVEERIERLETSVGAERRRLDAVRLLFETIADCKRAVVEAVVGPVQKRATQTLHRIAGGRLGALQFSSSFLPEAVSPTALGEPVPLEELSGGEQEQVHFAVRLALADIAFPNQRQLVVLDDAFTYTDTPRLARIMTILEEAAERFQIVVLSCHPERYRGLPGAEFFDLEQIASRR